MINRRTWIGAAGGGFAAFLFAVFAPSKRAQAASYRLDAKTLIYTLRVGRPEDEAFIGRVVAMMAAGNLPRSTVDKCYLWAKKKRKHKFQFFKRSLVLLAARQGITVK